jgi:hypothetical protein
VFQRRYLAPRDHPRRAARQLICGRLRLSYRI